MTEAEATHVFDVRNDGWRAYEHNPETIMVVTLEANLDLKRIERGYYTLIDVLSDVGGLEGALLLLGQPILKLIIGESLKDYLVYQLYNIETTREKTNG